MGHDVEYIDGVDLVWFHILKYFETNLLDSINDFINPIFTILLSKRKTFIFLWL